MWRRCAIVLLVLVLGVVPALAQNSCPAIVERVLGEIGQNCAELDRNTACYGFTRVDSSFITPQPADFFTQPRDRAGLLELDSIQTYPLDVENGEFGAAALNVQASVPNSLPGQGVVFLLLGDATLTNDVPSEEALQPVDPVSFVLPRDTVLFTGPSEATNALGRLAAGSEVAVDGLAPEGFWMRAILNDQIAWVRLQDLPITREEAQRRFPMVGASSRTPMQAFYFQTGIGQPTCSEAQSVIAVQSPQGINVDLTVNGVDIRVGSMISFQTIGTGQALMLVHRGRVVTLDGTIVNAGEGAITGLTNDDDVIDWQLFGQMTDEQRELGERLQEALNKIAEANGWPTFEIGALPTPTPTPQPGPTATNTPQPGACVPPPTDPASGQPTHVVQRGETLFAIALQYQASMPEIIRLNNISDPSNIFSGQRLIIPRPCTGFVGVDTPARPTDVPGVCRGFALVSPLGDVPVVDTLYDWTEAPGATSYTVVFYNYLGQFAAEYSVNAPQTSITLNTGQIPTGSELYWEVRAFRDGQFLCTTGRTPKLTRLAEPGPTRTPTPFNASRDCIFYNEAVVSWSNAQPDDTITVVGKDPYSGVYTVQGQGASGSVMVTGMYYEFVVFEVYASSGPAVQLPGCPVP